MKTQQSLGIHYSSAFYSTLLSFFFSRYLGLIKRHFSSDILVPFPASSDLHRRVWRSAVAGIQNKLLTGTIIVIHSEKEVSVVKNAGNIKENCPTLPHLTVN